MKNKIKMKNKTLVKMKMKELINRINYHDELYYKKNYQEISDEEYDKLRRDLLELEKKHPKEKLKKSPNKNVGKIDSYQFKTINHLSPMLSLNNAYNKDEVRNFYDKTLNLLNKRFNIMAETKVDGLSASLRYENRKLKIGLTRGDGTKGEDITRNLDFVEGIKKTLSIDFPKNIEISGEIFIKKNIFEELNKKRKMQGLSLFSTPRNAAAGSVRQLDPGIARDRKLSFYGYTIIGDKEFFGNSLNKIREILLKYNFSLNHPSKLCKSFEEMIKFYEKVSNMRNLLDYDIDGIVYKLDSIEEQKKLGESSRWPRWALAHKFPAENAITTIEDVSFQVGRTGVITPVAILKEVVIGGVKINRATLHNQDEIRRLNLSLGDKISIQRAGDVIPKITSVVKKSGKSAKIQFPEFCPSCGSKLQILGNEAAIKCINYRNCKEQKINSLVHFVSRNAFDISGLGEKQIRIFWETSFIRNFYDIFLLEQKVIKREIILKDIEGFGEKSISNLLSSINSSKYISFDRFIYSLGIRHVGMGVAHTISRKFNDFDKFLNYFLESNYKENIDGVGDVIINSIRNYLKEVENLQQIQKLLRVIRIKYEVNINHKFSNKVIVVTGSFKEFSRKTIEQKLIQMGAKISSSISRKTDFLFCGKDPGSKLDKAIKLNIKIITSSEVEDEINNSKF